LQALPAYRFFSGSCQVAELQAAGCAKVFGEKASGARGDRVDLVRLLKRLQPGDVLLVALGWAGKVYEGSANVPDAVRRRSAAHAHRFDSEACRPRMGELVLDGLLGS
jgi:hypothetical protein